MGFLCDICLATSRLQWTPIQALKVTRLSCRQWYAGYEKTLCHDIHSHDTESGQGVCALLNQHPGVAELLCVDFVFVCHDSAKQASLMALAAPNVRPRARVRLGSWHSLNQHLASALDVQPLLGHGVQFPSLQVIHGALLLLHLTFCTLN